jgi:hypothetical protein
MPSDICTYDELYLPEIEKSIYMLTKFDNPGKLYENARFPSTSQLTKRAASYDRFFNHVAATRGPQVTTGIFKHVSATRVAQVATGF